MQTENHLADLSPAAFEILRAAVNAVRQWQIGSTMALRERLQLEWPGREVDIEAAIKFWASHVRATEGQGNR